MKIRVSNFQNKCPYLSTRHFFYFSRIDIAPGNLKSWNIRHENDFFCIFRFGELLVLVKNPIKFEFRDTLFSKIRPNFCRPSASSVFKIPKFPSRIGAIHKRRRNILGGEWGIKFRCCKILEGRS